MRGHAARILVFLGVVCAVLLPMAAAQAKPAVSFTATVDGRSTSAISTNDPLVLKRGRPLDVDIRVTNNSARTITVAAARIQGKVMGLSFFSFDTQIQLKVAPGAQAESRFQVGLVGLADQADGLLPSAISLLDANSDTMASTSLPVDVKGHLTSIYGIFGLAIAAITALWLISLIYRVATRSLPPNRWSRAVQFSAAGFGVGLVLTFSVSALRLLTPNAGVWAPFVFGAGAVGLAIGYLTPGPRIEDDDEEEDFIASRQPQYAALPSASYGDQGQLGAGGGPAALTDDGPAALEAQPTAPDRSQPTAPDRSQPTGGPSPRPNRDTTVEVDRAGLDSIFGSRPSDPEQR